MRKTNQTAHNSLEVKFDSPYVVLAKEIAFDDHNTIMIMFMIRKCLKIYINVYIVY